MPTYRHPAHELGEIEPLKIDPPGVGGGRLSTLKLRESAALAPPPPRLIARTFTVWPPAPTLLKECDLDPPTFTQPLLSSSTW